MPSTLYVNYNGAPGSGSADASEAIATTTVKASGTKTTASGNGEVEFFAAAAHLVHVAPAGKEDADSAKAFYVFPNFPKRVKVGKGAKVSAKSLV